MRVGAGARWRWLAVAMVVAAGGCGDGGQSDPERVAATVVELQEDLADGRIAAVCAAMTDRAQRQVGSVGHRRKPTTCVRDLREFVLSTEAPPASPDEGLSRAQRPDVVDIRLDPAGDAATAFMSLGHGGFRVRFVRREDDWRLDDFFGAVAPAPRALR